MNAEHSIKQVIGNRALLEPAPQRNPRTSSTIVLPETFKPDTGEWIIVALGNSPKMPEELKVGQRVILDQRYGSQEVKGDVKQRIASTLDIIAIIEEQDGAA